MSDLQKVVLVVSVLLFSSSIGRTAQVTRTYPLFLKDDWQKQPLNIFVPLTVKCPPSLKPFVVTIPRVDSHWETCAIDRLGALRTLSTTVWTKEEWDDSAKEADRLKAKP